MKKIIRIFYSYSHIDEQHRISLETHLAILKRSGLILDWHDRKIIPGQTWASEIDTYLNEADIIILLISSDFIASDYCYGKEMEQALERQRLGKACLLPIILRPVDWMGAPFAKLQALPQDGKPVTTWENYDEAWLDIAKGVRAIIENISKKRDESVAPAELIDLKDLMRNEFKRIETMYDGKRDIGGTSTGFYDLDNVIDGIHKTDIILIAGRPTMGKSDFALSIASWFAIEEGIPVVFFSLRITPEQIMRRLLAAQSKVPVNRILRGFLGDTDWPKLTHAVDKLKETPLWFYESLGFTEIELAQMAARHKEETGLGLIVVDGMEYLTSAHKYDSRKSEIGEIIKTIKTISKDNHVPIILTVSTSHEGDLRDNKRPIIRDLGDCEPLASDLANAVLILYRPEVYDRTEDNPDKGIAEIIIAKNIYGTKITLKLAYYDKYCSFYNLERYEG